jgi:hypothetical protein
MVSLKTSHRRLGQALGLVALGLVLLVGSAVAEKTLSAQVAQRATEDRPDDLSGYQVHVMYILPSDGTDEELDINGAIARSVAAAQKWFVGQSNGRQLRLDTYQGVLDITFYRLRQSDREIRGRGPGVRDEIERRIRAAGFKHPQKIYAVYYGGGSDFACGGGAWPPFLRGTVAALYLKGTPYGYRPCATNPLAASEDTPGYWEFSFLHEILHTLGFVDDRAPNHTRSGHVIDDPRDLMYAGPHPWRPSLLDIGRDDYFEHGQDYLDLAKSVFLDPTAPDAVPPPGWP